MATMVVDSPFGAVTTRQVRPSPSLVPAIERVVDLSDLSLRFQPIIELTRGAIVGAEALVRWSPDGTLVLPDEFIPDAESSGEILEIGNWVLESACRVAREWLPGLFVSVNISPRQLADPGFADRVAATVLEARLEPGRLCLELTETFPGRAGLGAYSDAVARLQELGIRLAYDDFGTGYSTFAVLKDLPALDMLKIDRHFVAGVCGDRTDMAVVRSAVTLARGMGIEVVAEGVESTNQLDAVRAVGCDLAQGFRFAPPLTLERFSRLVARRPRW